MDIPPPSPDPSQPQPLPQQYSPQYYSSPVSPDGKYWWNGYQWIPLKRQTNPAIFLVGGCVVVLIVILLLAALGFANFHGTIYYDNNQIITNVINGSQ